MKYAVEMGSDAMLYIPNYIKLCLAIEKLRIHKYIDSMDIA
jgi:hypothetical protein